MLQVRQSPAAAETSAAAQAPAPFAPAERSVYTPSGANRLGGAIGTTAIFGVVASIAMLVTLYNVAPTKDAGHLATFDVTTSPAPVEEPSQQDMSDPQESAESEVPVTRVAPETPPVIIQIAMSAPPAPQPERAAAEPARETRKESAPPPSPPRQAGREATTWEERVLAALNAVRRYPRLAMSRRQQGIPYIRFVMNRDGVVKSAQLERSSGFPDLDQEATALPKRASPLPPPDDSHSGSMIELVVPVEFFLT